jgi:hypothetical protein
VTPPSTPVASTDGEGGLFQTSEATWVLAVMADQLADWGNGAAAAGPTLRAEVARAVFETWANG